MLLLVFEKPGSVSVRLRTSVSTQTKVQNSYVCFQCSVWCTNLKQLKTPCGSEKVRNYSVLLTYLSFHYNDKCFPSSSWEQLCSVHVDANDRWWFFADSAIYLAVTLPAWIAICVGMLFLILYMWLCHYCCHGLLCCMDWSDLWCTHLHSILSYPKGKTCIEDQETEGQALVIRQILNDDDVGPSILIRSRARNEQYWW